jgi:DNA-binding NtrC family response regulator
MLETGSYNCILKDVIMPGRRGDELLKIILQKSPETPVIIISGLGEIRTAVQCIKDGAYDYIEKPIDPEKLFITIKNAISTQRLKTEYETLFNERLEEHRIIGGSAKMQKLFQTIQTVATTSVTVLIKGESGTGKELVARAVHDSGNLRGSPFVSVNCAAIPPDLLESELFGHRKGAFTGALSDRKGKFIEADGGTIFLDEIGDLDIRMQPKLLRVLQEGEVEVVGENIPQKVEVRIIAASNKNLEKLVKEEKFREELLYRLNVVEITIPALRERIEDIPLLVDYFLKKFCSKYNKKVLSIHPHATTLLMNHDWPGNVRELEHLVERLVVFAQHEILHVDEVQNCLKTKNAWNQPIQENDNDKFLTLKDASYRFEKNYILSLLNHFNWKRSKTAEVLGLDRSNLFKKMHYLGIIRPK